MKYWKIIPQVKFGFGGGAEGGGGKACAVQVFPARDDELLNPDVMLERGRY